MTSTITLLVRLLAAVALLTFAAACGAPAEPTPVATASVTGASEAAPPRSPATVVDDETPTDVDDDRHGPDAPASAVVARAVGDLEVFDHPDDPAPVRVLPATTDFGTTTVVLVRDGSSPDGDWLEVLLPGRPTGAVGWVRAGDVEQREVDVEVRVDLAARELAVHRGDEVVLTTQVTIGTEQYPTPTGRFFVTDKLDTQDEDGPYGPYALGLSARSEVLTEFAGGDGQIGIHGTNDPDTLGQPASHGCVRVPNDIVRQLVSLLPLGTPVVVS
jgi:lipoprotein-anchoring transpeptidase ErfK/SrfK